MNCIKRYATAMLLLLSLPGIAQIAHENPNRIEDKIHPNRLFVGDKLDLNAYKWSNMRNYPSDEMKLSDFKGKYIILDFWTKSCSVCIAAFPKMAALQAKFKDDIQILLVTKNTEQELAKLFVTSTNLKETKLPLVIGDSILAKQLFPHGIVPYHVWLDREGKVIATTSGAETVEQNLKTLVAGKPLNLTVRNEIFDKNFLKEVRDEKHSLLQVGNGLYIPHLKFFAKIPVSRNEKDLGAKLGPDSTSTNLSTIGPYNLPYYSLFMDFIPGSFPVAGKYFRSDSGKVKGFKLFNWDIDLIYQLAYIDDRISIVKTIAEGSANLLYKNDTTSTKAHKLVANTYSYESSLPSYTFEGAKKLLQQDLTRFFGMSAEVVERPLSCLILTKLGNGKEAKLWAKNQSLGTEYAESIWTAEGLRLRNHSFDIIRHKLESANNEVLSPIILNETGLPIKYEKGNMIDVVLKCSSLSLKPDNIANVRGALLEYGIGLKEETRIMKVLVLKRVL